MAISRVFGGRSSTVRFATSHHQVSYLQIHAAGKHFNGTKEMVRYCNEVLNKDVTRDGSGQLGVDVRLIPDGAKYKYRRGARMESSKVLLEDLDDEDEADDVVEQEKEHESRRRIVSKKNRYRACRAANKRMMPMSGVTAGPRAKTRPTVKPRSCDPATMDAAQQSMGPRLRPGRGRRHQGQCRSGTFQLKSGGHLLVRRALDLLSKWNRNTPRWWLLARSDGSDS